MSANGEICMLHEFISLNRDNIVRRTRSGLGLGLSIARDAVRAHQGDIHVRNMPGTGCVFSIDVPLVHDPESFSGLSGNPAVPQANAARMP